MKKLIFVLFVILLTACKTTTETTKTTSGSSTSGTTTVGTTATTTAATTVTTTTTVNLDAKKVADDKEALSLLGDLTNVTSNLILPSSGQNGTRITWQSNNANVIANDGTVTQPTSGGDVTVTLTATITLNSVSETKVFTVIVKQIAINYCESTSNNQLINGGFESGNLCGWTAEGDAFKAEYVKDTATYWGGNYNIEGTYLFTSEGHEGDTGKLTSSKFTLGGSGWISFKIGAAKNENQIYVSIKSTNNTEDLTDDTEIARFGSIFDDNQYKGNMAQLKANLSAHVGKELYIEIVDNASSDWAWISMDAFNMYYDSESSLPQDAVLAEDIKPAVIDCSIVTAPSVNEIINGGFDSGNLCGWTATGEAFTNADLTKNSVEWFGQTFAPEGQYLFSGWANGNEAKTGTLTSSTFTLGGSGWVSFRLGGAKPKTNLSEAVYISVHKADGTEIARYMNSNFNNGPHIHQYKADLTSYVGQDLYIKVVDNATADWGQLFMDSFNTLYAEVTNLPQNSTLAVNLIAPDTTAPVISGTHDFNLTANESEPNWLDGVTATDDKDGNVTVTIDKSNVNLTAAGTYTLIYTAVDAAGNTATKEVNVVVASDDQVAPTITGTQTTIYILVDSTEPNWLDGVSANDNVDGDLTSSITLDKGLFDIAVQGSYTLTFTVTDQASNTKTVTTTVVVTDVLPTIVNGGFETGDFTGWTATGDAFTVNGLNGTGGFNSDGTYHFNTWTQGDNGGQGENATGTLTSSVFKLSGSGFITFKIGGAKHTDQIYISIVNESNVEVARFGNTLFTNQDMYLYKADLTAFLGQKLYIKVVDNATTDWAFSMLDSFNTYYETVDLLPQDATLATNLLQ